MDSSEVVSFSENHAVARDEELESGWNEYEHAPSYYNRCKFQNRSRCVSRVPGTSDWTPHSKENNQLMKHAFLCLSQIGPVQIVGFLRRDKTIQQVIKSFHSKARRFCVQWIFSVRFEQTCHGFGQIKLNDDLGGAAHSADDFPLARQSNSEVNVCALRKETRLVAPSAERCNTFMYARNISAQVTQFHNA